jgi:hypothetical protein
MRFYQLWEELNQRLSQEDFYKIVKNSWGSCQHHEHPDNSVVACDYENRHLIFNYIPSVQTVGIAFGWNKSPQTSSKEPTTLFAAGTELQSGTIEGMHKFVDLAKIFKLHGLKISFMTSGRREKLYDIALTRAGYHQTERPGLYE